MAGDAVLAAATRAALDRSRPGLRPAIVAAVAELGPSQRASHRRAAELEQSRIDASHPPTHLRLALLESQPESPPAVDIATARAARIDAELEPLLDRVLISLREGILAGH